MSYVKLIGRIAKSAGKLMVMDTRFCGKLEESLANAKKVSGYRNMHKSIWNSLKDAEKYTRNDKFFEEIWKTIKETPKDLRSSWTKSTGLLNTTKAVGGTLLKRLPLLFVAMEIPNIYRAYRDEGLIGGTIEAGKSLFRGAAGMAGFAIGQTLIPIPIIGGLIGAFATDWVASKILGKSHTEKLEEAEALKQSDENQYQEQQQQLQRIQQNNPYMNMYGNQNQLASNNYINMRPTMTPQQIMAMRGMLYGGGMTNPMDQDFMAMTSGINRLNYMC